MISQPSTNNSQLELKPFEAAPDDVNVLWLEKFLLEAKCWMTARDIKLSTSGRLLDRELRELASASSNIISGQKGYKHVANSTAEEIDHSANWLISQGKKMIKRGIGQRRQAHAIIG